MRGLPHDQDTRIIKEKKKYKHGHSPAHKAAVLRWRKKHPEQYKTMLRRQRLKSKYGLTEEAYNALLTSQNNLCALCKQPLNHDKQVDHDHKTNKIRGIIHSKCNLGLGHFDDDVTKLALAIEYLMRNN